MHINILLRECKDKFFGIMVDFDMDFGNINYEK